MKHEGDTMTIVGSTVPLSIIQGALKDCYNVAEDKMTMKA
jgi:hypothetical protein